MLRPLVILSQLVDLSSTNSININLINYIFDLFSLPIVSIIIRSFALLIFYFFILRVWLAFYDFKKRNHLLDLKWKTNLQLNNQFNNIYSPTNNNRNNNNRNNNNNNNNNHNDRNGNRFIYPWTVKYQHILGNPKRLIIGCLIYYLLFVFIFILFIVILKLAPIIAYIFVVISCLPFILIAIYVTHRLKALNPDILQIKSEFGRLSLILLITLIAYVLVAGIMNFIFGASRESKATFVALYYVTSLAIVSMSFVMVWRDDPGNSAYLGKNQKNKNKKKKKTGSKNSSNKFQLSNKHRRQSIQMFETVKTRVRSISLDNRNKNRHHHHHDDALTLADQSNMDLKSIMFANNPNFQNNRHVHNASGSHSSHGSHGHSRNVSNANYDKYTSVLINQLTQERRKSIILSKNGDTISLRQLLCDKQGFKAFANHCVGEYNIENLLFILEYMQIKQFLLQKKLSNPIYIACMYAM